YLSFLFELPLMIFGVLTSILVEKLGRLRTMSMNGIIIGVAAIIMSFLLHNSTGLIIMFIIAAGTSIMYFGIAYSLAAELYPTQIRGAGEGYNTSLSRLSGALAYLLTPVLVLSYGESGLWKIYGSLAIVGIAISFFMLRPYLKVEGKTLEQISDVEFKKGEEKNVD
ncbi:MAG: MFS transporter, partial [Thermoplasmatales archaeon]